MAALHPLLRAFLSFCIATLIILSSLFFHAYSLEYYERQYSKHGIYERFPREAAMDATKNILGFFRSSNDLDAGFFNGSERAHLADVKILVEEASALFGLVILSLWAFALLELGRWRRHFLRDITEIAFGGGMIVIAAILFLGFAYFLSGFDSLFLKFHEAFFAGNYAFNPAVSNMKALFPDAFFMEIGQAIAISALAKAIVLSACAYVAGKIPGKDLKHWAD